MIELDIPGFKPLRLEHVVLDYNGTIACDGQLLPEVSGRLKELGQHLTLHIITADTFGTVREQVAGLAEVVVLKSDDHRDEKHNYVFQLGHHSVAAFGNGRNDVLMLKSAGLGVAVCQREGAAAETLQAADVVCRDILDGLDLLRFPKRLLATLRA